MYQEFGYFYSKRIDMKLTPQLKDSLAEKLANPPTSIDSFNVRSVNKTDGVKLIFDDNAWLLFRLSGTEPVARIYAEACSPKDLKHVLDSGKKWALS
jgi:phosphomannomutase